MLGAIIGDVAGSTYEVEEIKLLKTKNINYNDRIKILSKEVPLFNDRSSYTDDTVLTACIASSILNNKKYDDTLKEFGLKELSLGLDKYGRCRFSKGFVDWLGSDYVGSSYGNGCAMRISPIANYFDSIQDITYNTFLATYPSHNNAESYKASLAVSYSIYLAKCKKSKNYIKNVIERLFNYNLDFDLNDLQHNYLFSSRASKSVPQAIYCFLISNDFEDAIRNSISIGGDTDTIASITGAISEAYYGIDKSIICDVEKYLPDYVIDITNKFYKELNKEEPFKQKQKSI